MSDFAITVFVGTKEFSIFEQAAEHVLRQIEEAPERAAKRVSREIMHGLQRVAAKMREMHSSPWGGGVVNTSDRLQKRSGRGLQSILDSLRVSGSTLQTLQGSISTGDMTIHETGGVINAKGSRYLTIPLPAALDSRGVPLLPSARDWPNTFVQRSRKGNLIIFQKRGREIVPLYVLKTTVRIKPRLRMEQAVMGEIPYLQERILDAIAKEIVFS